VAHMTVEQTNRSQSTLFPAEPPHTSETGYRLMPSVWEGEDRDLLELMLEFYPHRSPERILDATVNAGRFWRGSQRPVVGMDINLRFHPDVVGDNLAMPFRRETFDVVVYDPPHIPNQGKDRSKDFNTRFGLVLKSSAAHGYNFSHLYLPFAHEAYRLLKPDGLLLCKIADYVHNHRLQWAHVDLIHAATEAGFCPCDCIVKVRKGPIVDPKWQVAHHARRHHCYWLVFRKSGKCE
jgi:SAM-dependent methyltransferase